MQKKVLFIGIMLIILVGCTPDAWKGKEYSFAQGFADLKGVEAPFNGSFKNESLNSTVVALDQIDPFSEKLQEVQKNVEKTKDGDDKKALLLFIDVRKNMLTAEKNFQLAMNIGDIGRVDDPKGFSCGEAKYILDASYYLNESLVAGRNAEFGLDDLLNTYKEVPQLQDLVGLNANKTKFYASPLDAIHDAIDKNYKSLEKDCKIKVVTNQGKGL